MPTGDLFNHFSKLGDRQLLGLLNTGISFQTQREVPGNINTPYSQLIDDDQKLPTKDASRILGARNFDAICDAQGQGGDFNGVDAFEKAVGSGAKRIYLRSGTYVLSQDILLTSNHYIVGEDKYNVIIDCNGANQISAVVSDIYSTGTITLNKDSTAVSGSGTSWSTNLAANDFLAVNGVIYTIASVTDNTNLVLTTNYEGETTAGLTYMAGTFITNLTLSNFTIKDYVKNTANCIQLQGIINSLFSNIIIENATGNNATNGISFNDCSNIISENLQVKNCESRGIRVNTTVHSFFLNNEANNNGTFGFSLSNADYCQFLNCRANANNADGIFVSNSDNNLFANQECILNDFDGFAITSSNYNSVSNGNFILNGDEGVYINGNYNSISNCSIGQSNDNGLEIRDGSYNTIQGNKIFLSENHGMLLINDSDYNTIVSNTFVDNGQKTNDTYSDILLANNTGAPQYNVISGNTIRATQANKTEYGIEEDITNVDFSIISNNIIQGQVKAAILLSGANSIKSANIE